MSNGNSAMVRGDVGMSMGAGMVAREDGLGGRSIERLAETSAMAVAEQARASVQARYLMALQRPRDIDDVRVRLLRECRRPRFASVARYRKPIGKGVEGPSIRFAEAAVRAMGNIDTASPVVFDDGQRKIVRVSVTDLETNVTYSQDIAIEKTVERSQLKEGVTLLGSRANSNGRTVYIVAATEDDLLNKTNALVSKAVRTLALRLVPGDILDECMEMVISVQQSDDARDPEAARKALADAFSGVGVRPSQLAEYLGHSLEQITPAELTELRGLYSAIRDGEASWSEAMEAKRPDAASTEEKPANPAADKLREKLKKQAAPTPAATAPATTAPTAPAVQASAPAAPAPYDPKAAYAEEVARREAAARKPPSRPADEVREDFE